MSKVTVLHSCKYGALSKLLRVEMFSYVVRDRYYKGMTLCSIYTVPGRKVNKFEILYKIQHF